MPYARLHDDRVFRVLRQRSTPRVHSRLATLAIVPNGLDVSRIAYSASKRVGNAVERNRAIRIMREAIRQNPTAVAKGWDCLFSARKAAIHAPMQDMESAVLHLLAKADILAT